MNNLRWYGLLMMGIIYFSIFLCKNQNSKKENPGTGENVNKVQLTGNRTLNEDFNQQPIHSRSGYLENDQPFSICALEMLLMVDQKKWKTLLQLSKPIGLSQDDLAIWYYSQGIASLRVGDISRANTALGKVEEIYINLSIDQLHDDEVNTSSVQQVLLDLQGEITSTITSQNLLAVNM